jgi:AcrR family transcriptional regulator
MSRWESNTRERLEKAAFDLFKEQGFAATTVAEITERAGLTKRTFFRYFNDKREVLFASHDEQPLPLADVGAGMMVRNNPSELLEYALQRTTERLQGQYEYLKARQEIIKTDESLRERELQKQAELANRIKNDAIARQLDRVTAELLAKMGVAIISSAVYDWLESNNKHPLANFVEDRFIKLRKVFAD